MCLLAILALTYAHNAQAAAAASEPLSLIGATGQRTITLSSCQTSGTSSKSIIEAMDTGHCVITAAPGGSPNTANKTQLVAIGQLLLAVRNSTGSPALLNLRYVREDGHAAQLPGCSTLAQLAGTSAAAQACVGAQTLTQACSQVQVPPKTCPKVHLPVNVRANAHSITTLPLRFALLSNESPQALRGAIYIQSSNHTIVVPLDVGIQDMPGVQPESTVVRLSTDTWDISDLWAAKSVTVTVTGPGVGAMLTRQPLSPRKYLLHNGGGNTAEVELGTFQAQAAEPEEAQTNGSKPAKAVKAVEPLRAVATLTLVNHPHTGTYHGRIALSELDPSAATLDVHLRTHLPWWLAVLFVLIGTLVAMIVAPLALLRMHADELQVKLSEAVNRYRRVARSLDGMSALSWQSVLWDLNDLTTASHDVVTASSDEVGLVSVSQQLAEQIGGERDEDDFNADAKGVLDVTARLSRWLRVAPAALRLYQVADETQLADDQRLPAMTATAQATRLLLKRLRYEPPDPTTTDDLVARVLRQSFWHQSYREAVNAAKAKNDAKRVTALKKLDGKLKNPDVMQRTSAAQDALELELEDLRGELDLRPATELPMLPVRDLPEVNWAATPTLFSGWSTLDGASFRNLRAHAERRYKAQSMRPSRAEWLWSLFFALVSSIVYAFTVYNSTWGSTKDILTALTAGFAGAVVMKVALPIFKSQRLSPAAPNPASQGTGTPAAG
jgi:hypothetical protein